MSEEKNNEIFVIDVSVIAEVVDEELLKTFQESFEGMIADAFSIAVNAKVLQEILVEIHYFDGNVEEEEPTDEPQIPTNFDTGEANIEKIKRVVESQKALLRSSVFKDNSEIVAELNGMEAIVAILEGREPKRTIPERGD